MQSKIDIPENSIPEIDIQDHHLDFKQTRLDKIVIWLGYVIGSFYLITVFITLIEVVMRYFFDHPTSWVFETSIMLVGTAMLYGGAYCMSNNGHIRVTVVTDLLPLQLQKWLNVLTALLTLLFMLSLCYAAYFMLVKSIWTPSGSIRLERSGSAFNSIMPAEIKFMLFVVVCLMAVQSLVQLCQATLQAVIKGDA